MAGEQTEMYEIITDEVWHLRDQLFRKGQYTTPPTYEPWVKNTGEEPVECPEGTPAKAIKKLVKSGVRRKPAKRKSVRGGGSNEA